MLSRAFSRFQGSQLFSRLASRATPAYSGKLLASLGTITPRFFSEVGNRDTLTFDTLHELQIKACDTYGENPVFGTFDPSFGEYKYMSYADYGQQVDRCRSLLSQAGVGKNDKVAIISNNRWEWATLAAASYSLSASFVPMYEAQHSADWAYILNDSGSSVVFGATQDIYDRLHKEVLPSTPTVNASFCLDAPLGESHAFSTAMAMSTPDTEGLLKMAPSKDDLANLIYTSGTTGKPKGVELTHENSATNIVAPLSLVENPRELMEESDRTLAFLPWAHSYGQTCELWMTISAGGSMGICRGVPYILEDLQLVKPSVLFAVPTLYKKVYDGVNNLVETSSPVRKRLMQRAMELGEMNAEYRKGNRGPLGFFDKLEFNVLDNVVLSKIRDKFGGNLKYGAVAGAASPPEVISFMDSIGIPVCEGYGLTETSPVISINVPSNRRVGTVGLPVGGVKVYVVDEDNKPVSPGEEGEICCTGPNIMRGYHRKPEATEEVITMAPDGVSRMFHTGDLGRLDEDGWLHVTGRLKEQYKLENGKYVVPTPVENALGLSRFIAQIVLVGANRPYNVALIVPDWAVIRTHLGIDENVSEEDVSNDHRVKDLIDEEIKAHCACRKKFEIPLKWAFVAPFTIANNMLTPKMSIRRHNVTKAYDSLISSLYDEEGETEHQDASQAA
eukprot:Nitzschia sp. Nitz4//scaffold22_size323478//280954//283102//NITZ4_000583-RA/size323478-augustus-gene-0.212-mRNA-1//1//CDS//3329543165//8672//frame0